jgi:hypothetical protein
MDAGGLTFLTEENSEKLRPQIPAELWALKQQELELKKAAMNAPARAMIKDAWTCMHCECMNAGELAACADCGDVKPTVKTEEK